jgi:hypothetical protein
MRGEATSVLAVLDHATRARISDNLFGETIVSDDTVRWQAAELIVSAQRLEKRIRDLLAFAKSLRNLGAEIPARLAGNAARDPVARVRLANLRALQRGFPNGELARDVSQAALRDEDPAVRLEAAQFLGEQGLQTLRELVLGSPKIEPRVRSEALRVLFERAPVLGERAFRTLRELVTGDSSIETAIRSDALRILVESAPRETVIPLLDQILDESTSLEWDWALGVRGWLWLQAAAACGELRHAGATARLIRALDRLDPSSAKVVVEALGTIGDPAAEPALITLLNSEDEDTAIAATHALNRFGTVAAVEPLRARIDDVLADRTLKQAARDAIEAIQGRLRGAERGQLGLAEAAGAQGRLSVSDPPADGRLSLSNPPRPEGESEHE